MMLNCSCCEYHHVNMYGLSKIHPRAHYHTFSHVHMSYLIVITSFLQLAFDGKPETEKQLLIVTG